MKKSILRQLLLVAFAASVVSSASAQSISYTNSVTALDATNFWTLSLNQFDTTLGTLTGVEVRVNFSQTGGTFSVTNSQGSVETLFAWMDATIQGSSTNLGFATLSTNAFELTSSSPAMPFSVPQGQNVIATVVPASIWTNQVQTIDPSFWSSYLGNGNVDFQVLNNSEVFILADLQGAPDAGNVSLQTSMTVTYTFVPEPSTYALLAMAGLGAAGYFVRRRR